MKISENLYGFLKDWNEWRKNGAPNNAPFNRGWGLCANLDEREWRDIQIKRLEGKKELYKIIEKSYDSICFPFNPSGFNDYAKESHLEECHLNSERIAFVEQKIREYES